MSTLELTPAQRADDAAQDLMAEEEARRIGAPPVATMDWAAIGAEPKPLERVEWVVADWRAAINEINLALIDADLAANQRRAVRAGLSILEAHATLTAEGKNEAQRAAAVVLALADNAQARAYRSDEAEAERRLADAQWRERIATERCRLARSLLALAARSSEA